MTFYELLTGQLPFNKSNPLDLIYCHLAKEPISPQELNPQIPKTLADIIMKLIAKTAENRYQTARRIKHDLEICQQILWDFHEIQPFKLGQKDRCDRFLLSAKIYGRETEISIVLNAFERVSLGR